MTWSRFLQLLAGLRGLAVALLVLTFANSLWAPVFPKIAAFVIDEVIGNNRPDKLAIVIAIAVGVGVLRDFLSYWRVRVGAFLGQELILKLRCQVYDKLQRLSVSWFDKQSTGDLMTRVAEDVPSVERLINEGMTDTVQMFFQLLVVSVVLFTMDWQLTLIAMVPVPFLAFGGVVTAPMARKRHRLARAASSGLNHVLHDNLAGIRQIKAYHLHAAQAKRFRSAAGNLKHANLEVNRFWAIYGPIAGSIHALGYVLVLWFGAVRALDGAITAGDLSAFLLLLWAFYDPIQRVQHLQQLWQSGNAAAERVFTLVAEPDEPDLETGATLQDIRGEVRFDAVNFSYGKTPTLQNVSLFANPGETIALVGASGAGKSTVLALLARFYDPDSGLISIDEKDIRSLSKASLRHALGYVTQEAFLFDGTVRENLVIANPTADDDQIWTALRSVNAADFVGKLPDGLDSEVGERAIRLSGGEKQRLSLARVILKNPPILLLDEATASVDNETEHLIQEALERLMSTRTTFVIAHRLTTIRNADRIFVFDSGQIIETGTHEQLIQKNGKYAAFVRLMRE